MNTITVMGDKSSSRLDKCCELVQQYKALVREGIVNCAKVVLSALSAPNETFKRMPPKAGIRSPMLASRCNCFEVTGGSPAYTSIDSQPPSSDDAFHRSFFSCEAVKIIQGPPLEKIVASVQRTWRNRQHHLLLLGRSTGNLCGAPREGFSLQQICFS